MFLVRCVLVKSIWSFVFTHCNDARSNKCKILNTRFFFVCACVINAACKMTTYILFNRNCRFYVNMNINIYKKKKENYLNNSNLRVPDVKVVEHKKYEFRFVNNKTLMNITPKNLRSSSAGVLRLQNFLWPESH